VQILWQPIEAARSASIQRLLFHEQVFPVCCPKLLPGRRMLRHSKALADLPLMHKGAPGGRGQGAEWSWPV
jgi:LysR family glycine cleavage system transcriptional activator